MSPSRDEWPPVCLSCGVGSGKQLWITLKSVWREQNPKGRLSKKRRAGRVLGPAGRRKVQLRKAVQGRPEHPSAARAGRCSLSHCVAQRRMDMAISRSRSWAGEGGETIQNNRTGRLRQWWNRSRYGNLEARQPIRKASPRRRGCSEPAGHHWLGSIPSTWHSVRPKKDAHVTCLLSA